MTDFPPAAVPPRGLPPGVPPPAGPPPFPHAGPPPAVPIAAVPVAAYASFGKRLGAFLIDTFIIWISTMIVFFILTETLPREDPQLCTIDGELYYCEPLETGSIGVMIIFAIGVFALIIGWYYGYNEGCKGQTVGKRIVGIMVVDKFNHQHLGIGRGIGRYFARILSGMVFCLGYLWAIWDRESEAWHDKMVNSSVVDPSRVMYYPQPGHPRP